MTLPKNLIASFLMKGIMGWPSIVRAGSKDFPVEVLIPRLWHLAGLARIPVHWTHLSTGCRQFLAASRPTPNQAGVISVLQQMHRMSTLGEGVPQILVGMETLNQGTHHCVEYDCREGVTTLRGISAVVIALRMEPSYTHSH